MVAFVPRVQFRAVAVSNFARLHARPPQLAPAPTRAAEAADRPPAADPPTPTWGARPRRPSNIDGC